MKTKFIRYITLLGHNVLFTILLVEGVAFIGGLKDKKALPDTLVVTVTAYRPLAKYTDKSPNWTSIGTPAIMGVCAVSQDLLDNHKLKYGDVLDVPDLGIYKIMDTMNARHTSWIDILVNTRRQELIVGRRDHVTITRIK